MKFIQKAEINKKKWDELASSDEYFSKSWFLDAISKNWGIVVDENYTKGFAFTYNSVFGVKIIYPCFLGRFIEFFNLGEDEIQQGITILKNEFKIGDINLPVSTIYLENQQKFCFQAISDNPVKNNLSKRMLKKANTANLTVKDTAFENVFEIIKLELASKVSDFNVERQNQMEKFLNQLNHKKSLLSFGIFNAQNDLKGGLLFFENDFKLHYISGACHTIERENGGMYLAMETAINKALSLEKNLDFGGSNIVNIQRFYLALGGENHYYYNYSWDNAPFWFKTLRSLSKKIKR